MTTNILPSTVQGGKSRKHNIIINMGAKDKEVTKKATSSSSSIRRMSYTSTMQASKVGTVPRRSILTSDGKNVDKASFASSKHFVQVLDEQGKDVTPRPLYCPEAGSVSQRQSKILSAHDFVGVTQTDFLSSFSVHQPSGTSISLAGPFSRTYGSISFTKSTTSTESLAEEIVEPGSRRETISSLLDVQVRREEMQEPVAKEELEKVVDIYLTETETIWIFDMPTIMVSSEAEEADKARKRNVAYGELCKNRVGNDRYVDRMMQTLNGAPKTKEVQCDKISTADKEIMATNWDLYDSFNALEVAVAEKTSIPVTSSKSAIKEHDKTTSSSCNDKASLTSSSIMDLESVILSRIHEEEEDRSEAILKSEKFYQDLFYMERVLMENIFQPKLAAYRQLPVFIEPVVKSVSAILGSDDESDKEEMVEEKEPSVSSSLFLELGEAAKEIPPPFLEPLWPYGCYLTKNNDVTCMAWNKLNPLNPRGLKSCEHFNSWLLLCNDKSCC